ncbi:MAG: EAL domain-containing protein [Gammaproteobacteria bacterium]|nr:EAL domain-containing protein [Gammaproteobacteria bacterium]MBU1654588.1 EAL domain-containing protein [Gammaproteobacteria bacterium]MBU1961166.1 EAL domain-containing protein [Gammaproteobacteria bacterium]
MTQTGLGEVGKNSLNRSALLLALIWTLGFLALGFWETAKIRGNALALATAEARANFFKDSAFRLWATGHGRIYVPVSAMHQPDPYMAHIPERDLTSPSGLRLTLINPATMVRQMDEHFSSLYGVAGRITSLHPLRPDNAPDAWERRALARFEQGEEEVFEFSDMEGKPHLRLMRPLKVEPGCLLCHGHQGWILGGIGGAVGVALPMAGYLAIQQETSRRVLGIFATLWLLGILVIIVRYRQMAKQQEAQYQIVTRLTRSEARKASILDAALDCIISIDGAGRIQEFNPAAERVFGYRRAEVMGCDLAEMLIPEDKRERHREGMRRLQQEGALSALGQRFEVSALHAAGHSFPVELFITQDDLGPDPIFTAFLRDLTSAQEMERKLSHQASHDALTDLFNRREFERRVQRLLDETQGEHCLLYMDLDQFKLVNDTSGHVAGDELLRQLSQVLKNTVRLSDTLARLGGDEFGVLLEYCTPRAAQRVAEAVLKAVESFHFFWEDRRYTVGISIGLVPIRGSETFTEIMSAADAACYAAKEHGRNRIQIYSPNDRELARRREEMDWVERIKRGLEENRFLLYRQAIVALKEEVPGKPLRYEFLVRLQDRDLLTPGAFLAPAERYGLMPAIDRWVVRNACAWLAAHPDELSLLDFASINLSGHTLCDENFGDCVIRALDSFAIPPEKICFEITETAAVSNLQVASRLIGRLKRLGYRFALDDFGSGMASFGYLKNLPVDFLKIDGTFVRDMFNDPIDLAMVRSINDIAQVLGKRTIAEFVESEAIKDELQKLGVDFVQGFAISRPEPLP